MALSQFQWMVLPDTLIHCLILNSWDIRDNIFRFTEEEAKFIGVIWKGFGLLSQAMPKQTEKWRFGTIG